MSEVNQLDTVDFTNNSFNKMIKAKVIRKIDSGLLIRLRDIHDKVREDGTCWNRRDMASEKTLTNIASIVKHLGRGGRVPAIEVQARPGGGVVKIDGYCRTEAYRTMDASGEGDVWVPIVPFEGDELAALVRIETSNRDSKLTPIEQLDLYQSARVMLQADGKKGTLAEIAELFDVSRQYVDQILQLEKLDDEGKALVESGKVKTADAIKAVRGNKTEDKGKTTEALKRAAAPKPILPSTDLLGDMYGMAQAIRSSLGKDVNEKVGLFLKGNAKGDEKVEIEVGELGRLLALLGEGDRQVEAKAEKARIKAEKAAQEAMAHDDLKQGEGEAKPAAVDQPEREAPDDEPNLGDDEPDLGANQEPATDPVKPVDEKKGDDAWSFL